MKTNLRLSLESLEIRATPAVVGYPDRSFGSSGRTVLQDYSMNVPDREFDAAHGMDLQSDGKILILGERPRSATLSELYLVRLQPDGTPDPLFGGGGRLPLSFETPGDITARPIGIAAQADGRTLVAGQLFKAGSEASTLLGILRLNPLGTFDPYFGSGGRRFVELPAGFKSPARGTASALGADGRFVIAVPLVPINGGPQLQGIVRINPDGTTDGSFGINGWQTVHLGAIPGSNDAIADLAVDANGAVYLAGTTAQGFDGDFAVVRLNPNGTVDTTFGSGGIARVAFNLPGSNNDDRAASLGVLPDGRVVVAGTVNVAPATAPATGNDDYGIVRLTANGQLDPTFGTDGTGKVRYGFDRGGNLTDEAAALAVQPDGRVVVVGTVDLETFDPPAYYSYYYYYGYQTSQLPSYARTGYGILRLNADGTPDRSFGFTGARVENPDSPYGAYAAARATAVVVQPNGRVVVGGNLSQSYGYPYYYNYLASSYSSSSFQSLLTVRLVGELERPEGLAVGGAPGGETVVYSPAPNGLQAGPAFNPFPETTGSVRVARADFNGDGIEDMAYAAGPGTAPRLRVVSGRTGQDLVAPQLGFEESFLGGMYVAAGDIDGDGRAEIAITPDEGGGPRVRIFTIYGGILVQRNDFYGIDDPNFRGGARAAFGDLNGDGRLELIVGAGFGGGPRVAVFDGRGLLKGSENPPRLSGDFLPFLGDDSARLRNGVTVASGDINGDGYDEVIVGGGPGGAPRVLGLDGALLTAGNFDTALERPLFNFFVAGNLTSRGGVRVATRNLDGDHKADLVTATGNNEPARVRTYKAANLLANASPNADQELDPFAGALLSSGVFVG